MSTLLFDYGGTLDTGACHWAYVLYDGYRHAGIELLETEFRTAYVYAERALAKSPIILPTDDFFHLLVKKVDLEFSDLEARGILAFPSSEERKLKVESVAEWCDSFARTHVCEANDILNELSSRHRLVMVSNFYGNLPTILRTYGMADLFDAVIESAVVGVRKPDPAIWQLGLDAAGCKPSEAVAIGDSYSKDILPAHSLGCSTIWFKGREWEEKAYDESIPSHIISSLAELPRLL